MCTYTLETYTREKICVYIYFESFTIENIYSIRESYIMKKIYECSIESYTTKKILLCTVGSYSTKKIYVCRRVMTGKGG